MEKRITSEKKSGSRHVWDVIVVGGGAAGLMAAIQAARSGAKVLILEHMERPGKKILMTGNGKCNFSNEIFHTIPDWQDEHTCKQYYHSACPAFVLPALKKFDINSTLNFFGELGIVPVARRGGYYPAGGQAAGVLAVMLMECGRLGISIECNIGIRTITKAENICKNRSGTEEIFVFDTKTKIYYARKCILATGGKSYKKTGSDGSGFLYVERLGHHIQDLVPALVPLQSGLAFFKKVAGIRAEISAKIYIDGIEKDCQNGELQLTDYGISGICIFQMSHLAAKAFSQAGQDRQMKKTAAHVDVELDFSPGMTESQTRDILRQRMKHPCAVNKTAAQSLTGWFPDKLGVALLAEAAIPSDQPCTAIPSRQIARLATIIKHFKVPVSATRSFEQAQVTAGGVAVDEVCADTMESKLVDGLYFAGEMLDVDGICGGFNLQWAWSSGAIAGRHAASMIRTGRKQS